LSGTQASSLTGEVILAPARGDSAAGDGTLWLARLNLMNFRSYAQATIDVDRRPVVLTGPNGAGKTNLLEAISFLAPGRGLRGAQLNEVDHRSDPADSDGLGAVRPSPSWSVAAKVVTPEGPRDLGTGCLQSGGGAAAAGSEASGGETRERRLIKIDGAFAKGQQALAEILRLVWLTPAMDGLLREGAAPRRRFLDRLVTGFDAGHAGRLAAYEQASRQRARLLKSGRGDDAWLSALEETMARHGVAVAAARRVTVGELARVCAGTTGPFPRAGLALAGEVDGWLAEMPALGVEDRLRAKLAAGRREDADTGGAAVGPHRSDLVVRDMESGRPASQGSTGEQKALLLSIVLAHARLVALERGAAPVLLLDEVVAHLDADRRAALFGEILALGAQAWLTGTDAGFFDGLGGAAQHHRVEAGRVLRAA
jgi:DNA replication and repair protein RecF